jgi:hypothetical protein
MARQDKTHGTDNAVELQAALDSLLAKSVFAEIHFRPESTWSPRSLVHAALLWSWSGKRTLTKRFEEARKIIAANAPADHPPGKSYAGFLKRLLCWSALLTERITVEFRRIMREELNDNYLVGGWLLLAGDGSRVASPRTRSNEQRFAAKKKQNKKRKRAKKRPTPRRKTRRKRKQTQADRDKKANSPRIWLTMLYHVGLGLPWDWRRGPSDSTERAHLSAMAKELPDNALLALDAGFVGYDFWRELDQSGTAFVARVGANVKLLKNLGYIRRRRDIVYVWPEKSQRKRQLPLALRLHSFQGGKEEVYLVTNVLEDDRLSESEMLEIYRARWGVEVYYRDLKQTFARGKLKSKTADNTLLELDWSILGLWAMCLYATIQHVAEGAAPNRRSVAGVLYAFRLPMEQYQTVADQGENLDALLKIALKDEYERASSKSSRAYPRKNKKRKIGRPAILIATEHQQAIAKDLKIAA